LKRMKRNMKRLKKEILGDDEEGEDEDEGEGGAADEEMEGEEAKGDTEDGITDLTDTDLINLRRTIYLTIMSSINFEECAHKLLKIKWKENQEMELCAMIIECCAQERTYLRFYGLLGQRFCMLNKKYQDTFDECFVKQYATIHRLETNKLRNVSKFFAHLLFADALPWTVLEYIHLNEKETTSSSRIFIKILFQELSESMGLAKLNERLKDSTLRDCFVGLFPIDNPKNTRFAINFFTSIGLGGLTDELRAHLASAPKMIMQDSTTEEKAESEDSDDSSSSSSSSDSSSESESDSESESSSSESDSDKKKKNQKKKKEESDVDKKKKESHSPVKSSSKKEEKPIESVVVHPRSELKDNSTQRERESRIENRGADRNNNFERNSDRHDRGDHYDRNSRRDYDRERDYRHSDRYTDRDGGSSRRYESNSSDRKDSKYGDYESSRKREREESHNEKRHEKESDGDSPSKRRRVNDD